jgi:hypothetical protein
MIYAEPFRYALETKNMAVMERVQWAEARSAAEGNWPKDHAGRVKRRLEVDDVNDEDILDSERARRLAKRNSTQRPRASFIVLWIFTSFCTGECKHCLSLITVREK